MFVCLFSFRQSVNANILGRFTKQISYPVIHQLNASGMTCTEAIFCVALNRKPEVKIHALCFSVLIFYSQAEAVSLRSQLKNATGKVHDTVNHHANKI